MVAQSEECVRVIPVAGDDYHTYGHTWSDRQERLARRIEHVSDKHGINILTFSRKVNLCKVRNVSLLSSDSYLVITATVNEKAERGRIISTNDIEQPAPVDVTKWIGLQASRG